MSSSLQHTRLSYSSPGVCSNSCPLSQWCHPIIIYSVASFSSCPQSFSASRYFPMSQLLVSGGRSIGLSASALVLLMNIQDWIPLGLTSCISLLNKGLLRVLSNTRVWRHQIFGTELFFHVQLAHPYMTTGKTIALTRWIFVSKTMSAF